MLTRLDADNDGKVSPADVIASARKATESDSDRDGVVSPLEEYAYASAFLEAVLAADTNGDGVSDKAELTVWVEALHSGKLMPCSERNCEVRAELLAKLADKDSDGEIAPTEMRPGFSSTTWNTNGDKILSTEEVRLALLAKFKAEREAILLMTNIPGQPSGN